MANDAADGNDLAEDGSTVEFSLGPVGGSVGGQIRGPAQCDMVASDGVEQPALDGRLEESQGALPDSRHCSVIGYAADRSEGISVTNTRNRKLKPYSIKSSALPREAANDQSIPTPLDFAELRASINARLAELIDDRGCSLSSAMRHGALAPGKRLRPIMTILACRQCGATDHVALDAACAIELVHAASLVMDDMPSMDDARLRRGVPTTHKVYGESTAMLAVVALLNKAFQTVTAMDGLAPQAKVQALDLMTAAIGVEGLAGGQACDLRSDLNAGEDTLKTIEDRHSRKTGSLFGAAAAIGGACANAPKVTIERLHDFGASFGLAYQTFDDVIDANGCEASAGKDTGKDENKSTVVSKLGCDGAREKAEYWISEARNAACEAAGLSDNTSTALLDFLDVVSAPMKKLAKI
ncbi:MAG: polyprenyl synthetase family protein [Pseudomonadota bacterium]